MSLTSRQEPDSSVSLDKQSGEETAGVQTPDSDRIAPKCFAAVLQDKKTWLTCFVYSTIVHGQSAGLSMEVCLYAGTDSLKHICQPKDGERLIAVNVCA